MTRYGSGRGEFFEGLQGGWERPDRPSAAGTSVLAAGGRAKVGNTVNLMSGSGAQQTREQCAEETVEVVRNGTGGTSGRPGRSPAETDNPFGEGRREWTHSVMSEERLQRRE